MKLKLLVLIALAALVTQQTQARELISGVYKYIHKSENRIIELGDWNLSDDKTTNRYYNYGEQKWLTVQMLDYVREVNEIAGIQKGSYALVQTYAGANNEHLIERLCKVFYVFADQRGFIGCRAYEEDKISGKATPKRVDFFVADVANIIPNVDSFDGIEVGSFKELKEAVGSLASGKTVKVLALFPNGEAIIENAGINLIDTSGPIMKPGIEKTKIKNLK